MTSDDTAVASRSVERLARIMDLFLRGRPELDLTEIAELAGFSKATTHRYCASLRSVGYLRYDQSTARYGLGARMIEFGAVATEGLPLAAAAEPYIHDLVKMVDRTIVMTVWDGHAPVIVRSNDNTSSHIRISVRVGVTLPVMSSAQGLTYLAFSPRIYNSFKNRPELDGIEAQLKRIRRDGVCIKPASPGLIAMAVPIFSGEEIPGTLAVLGSVGTIPREPTSRMATLLIDASRQMSRELSVSTNHLRDTAG